MHLTNVRAVGLKQFVVDDADLQLAGLKFNMALSVPGDLTITGDHESDGQIGGMFSLKGQGPFRYNVCLKLSLTMLIFPFLKNKSQS